MLAPAVLLSALLISAGTGTNADEAKKAFEEGVALLDDARYAEAASALERSIAVKESAAAVYNLGLAYRGLGRYQKAIAQLQRYLALAPAAAAEQRLSAANIIGDLDRALVQLTVEVKGQPNELRLDGEALALSGARVAVAVDPGTHVIEAVRRGYRPARVTTENLAPGTHATARIDAGAEPLPAIVEAIAEKKDAAIRVDGVVRGLGQARVELEPGHHTLEVEGGERRELELGPGSEARVTLGGSEPGVLGRWWFWAGAAVVVAAAVTSAVVISQSGGADYDNGNLGFTLRNLGPR